MSVMNCFDNDEAIGHCCIIVARWSPSWHHCRCLFALLLSSSSPCCQPLLLDFGHHCLFVLLSPSSHRHRKTVVIMALLSLSLCVVVVVVIPLFVNHCFCWIVGFWPSSSSLCVAVVTPLFLLLLLLLSVLGHHHCCSGLAHFQLIFLYSYFAFYFMC